MNLLLLHTFIAYSPKLYDLQYSYTNASAQLDSSYFNFTGSTLDISLFEGDQPFKEDSETYPRTEIRFKDEVGDGLYWYNVTCQFDSIPKEMQFSWMQVFGRKPLVMLRKRNGVYQMVSFESKEKITEFDIKDVYQPTTYSLLIDAHRDGSVTLYVNGDFVVKVTAKIVTRDKMHLKLGPYAQQMDPVGITTIKYSEAVIASTTSVPCQCNSNE